MSDTCAVVTIETENGPVEINATDYDANIHKLAGEPQAVEPAPEPEPEPEIIPEPAPEPEPEVVEAAEPEEPVEPEPDQAPESADGDLPNGM